MPFRITSDFGYYMRIGIITTICHRLIIVVIALFGLLTALISISITMQDAYALNFEAVFNHNSTRIENQTTNNLFFPFQPNNTLYLSHSSNLRTIDFWLNVPLEQNHIDNDFEIFCCSLINLNDTDIKKNFLPDNIYETRLDPFDPSQIIVQKFTSIFLLFASVFIIMLFFTCAGLVFLDKITFRTVLRNCFRSDKSISWNRVKKEIRKLFQFALKIFIIIVCYIVLNVTLLFLCHEYIVPIPIVIKIFSVFDVNPAVWEENIEIGVFGDIGAEYEQWSKAKGFSSEMGRFWQEFLWNYWYIFIALALYFVFTFYFSVFKLSLGMFMRYKKRVSRRSIFYYSVDRHRLNIKMLEGQKSVSISEGSTNAISN